MTANDRIPLIIEGSKVGFISISEINFCDVNLRAFEPGTKKYLEMTPDLVDKIVNCNVTIIEYHKQHPWTVIYIEPANWLN